MPLSSLCCISRRRCQSFPIHEKQHETEVNKIFIRHVERIRVTPPPLIINHQQDKQTKTKATVKDFNGETYLSDQQTKTQSIIEKKSTHSRISLGNIFHKSNQMKTPSPVADIPEVKHDKTIVNTSSSWSLSTNSQSNRHKKTSKHRSHVESYDLSQKTNISQHKKASDNIKSSAKSKLVLENVKKMINDQNIHQQHYHDTRQKESARL